MIAEIKKALWQQFGAAIDMLENAIMACPVDLWGDRNRNPEYWYTAYHALFWLDYYLSDKGEDFVPPAPFGIEEFDPAGIIPDRVYSKNELLDYLEHGRDKCRAAINALTDERAKERWVHGRADFAVLELHFYNLRHVQHHVGQLNLMLRQATNAAPGWVRRSKSDLSD